MNAQQAIAAAQVAAPRFGVPPGFQVSSAELRIVELVANAPVVDALPPEGPVVDRSAWVVTFSAEPLWAELTVDDQTGDVVRIRRSRMAAAAWPADSDATPRTTHADGGEHG